ncbi:hypothetical protein BLNAU_22825 [Blattamonas nauphoetae]|uniref:Uncharacterized protein n=1 Tax=Blattamonas nauphoetae TaxID=2049346 RepID=A0ABQ9WS00_9EUKA|nr:hypothetical protein BLNAU_22825 [Blattamonas nauphoetae]
MRAEILRSYEDFAERLKGRKTPEWVMRHVTYPVQPPSLTSHRSENCLARETTHLQETARRRPSTGQRARRMHSRISQRVGLLLRETKISRNDYPLPVSWTVAACQSTVTHTHPEQKTHRRKRRARTHSLRPSQPHPPKFTYTSPTMSSSPTPTHLLDESSFDWGSRGGSGGLNRHDKFEEIKTSLAQNKAETNKSADQSHSSSIPSLTSEDCGMIGSIQEVLGIDKDCTRTGMKEAVPVCLRRTQPPSFDSSKCVSVLLSRSYSQYMSGDLIMNQALWNNAPLNDELHFEWVEVTQSETDDENETGQSEEQKIKSDNVSVNIDSQDTPQGLASQFPLQCLS